MLLKGNWGEIVSKVACRAGLWYNEDLKMVVLGGACDTPNRTNLLRRFVVNNLPRITLFMQKVTVLENGCWQWTAYIGTSGYGQFKDEEGQTLAHRWAYKYFTGPIPEGWEIDHLCRNRWCVNPQHLEAVTTQENVLRSDSPCAINAKKTHCSQGHPYDSENTYEHKGKRYCRTCVRNRMREVNRRKRRH